MKTVGLFEAKTKLSELCSQIVSDGEPIVVTRRGKPWVRIEPVREERPTIRERRATYLAHHGSEEKADDTDFAPPARLSDLPREPTLD